MISNKLKYLNNYFDKYIKMMLIKDIELLKTKNDELKFSYPYILLVCSCVDLFGGIEKGFTKPDGRANSKERFTWFITDWMGKINPLYKEDSLADLIYDSWRCGVMHQATLKKGFETSSYLYPGDKHLHYIRDKKRIFVHSLQFADDFIEAQKLYRQHINSKGGDIVYIELLYAHLLEMLEENKSEIQQKFNQFIQLLQSRNLMFSSKDSPTTTSQISALTSSRSSSQATTTRLPDNDELYQIPSAAPDEDDLEKDLFE